MKRSVLLATLVTIVFFLTAKAAPLGGGVPAVAHYIDHEQVAATLVKGGPIVSDPGFVILANRRGAGAVEYHDHTNHIFFILEGEGTVVVGGTMVNPKRTSPDQMTATSIDGGETYHLSKGDVLTIPAKTPHWWKDIPSKSIAYYAVNIESQ